MLLDTPALVLVCFLPVYPVPGLFVAAPECVSARPAAAGYWPGSFLSSAPVVPLSAAWHLPVRRTPSQAVVEKAG